MDLINVMCFVHNHILKNTLTYLFHTFCFQNDSRKILKCLQYGREKKMYCDAVRSFALTLHLYSPRGYNFVRDKFEHHLPDPSCLRSWYSNCTGFGEPGLCVEALKSLKEINNKTQLYVSLSFDEMHIRRHVSWNEAKNKFMGLISYGSTNANGELPVAQQALVFLVTGINFKISIPVAYFYITTLTAAQKAFLIREIVGEITKTGCKVVNITFDGLASNPNACELLGASFSMNDFRPYFPNPVDGTKVHIMYDACHMLKLIRKYICKEKVIHDRDGKEIKWKYFDDLESERIQNGLVTHKVTKKHIMWEKNKMNVALAAELLSNSVADSFDFLRKQNNAKFENSEATSEFIRVIDKMFDIFNTSGTGSTNNFKNALSKNTAKSIFDFLDYAINYLKSLTVHGSKMSETYVGIKGFIINAMSLKNIYQAYVETDLISNLPTYQMSQDPLESLFGRCRTINGNNDNPDVTQFTSAYRKILVNNELKASKLANCEDRLQILSVSSKRIKKSEQSVHANINYDAANSNEFLQPVLAEQLEDLENSDSELIESLNELDALDTKDFLLNCGEEASIARIAGLVEKKIMETARFECDCKKVLFNNEKVVDSTLPENNAIPCISTVYACKVANGLFNKCRNKIDFEYDKLIEQIMKSIDLDNVFSDFFNCDSSHKAGFVLYIIKEFVRVQATYIAKNLTLIEQKILCRNTLNKKIHVLGL